MWVFGGFGGYDYGYGGLHGGLYEEAAPWGSAAISERAEGKLNEAKALFDNHIALVDVTQGPATHEIIDFHLVTFAQKQFRDYVKKWGVKPTFRFESKKGRKSKVCFTSVTITAAAKAAFLAERPGQLAIAQTAAAAAARAAAAKAQAAAEKAARAQGKKGGKKAAAPAGGAENVAPVAKRARA